MAKSADCSAHPEVITPSRVGYQCVARLTRQDGSFILAGRAREDGGHARQASGTKDAPGLCWAEFPGELLKTEKDLDICIVGHTRITWARTAMMDPTVQSRRRDLGSPERPISPGGPLGGKARRHVWAPAGPAKHWARGWCKVGTSGRRVRRNLWSEMRPRPAYFAPGKNWAPVGGWWKIYSYSGLVIHVVAALPIRG